MGKYDLIPRPRSEFLKVKCPKCGNEQIIFNRGSTFVKCTLCEELLAEPTAGLSKIRAEILQKLG